MTIIIGIDPGSRLTGFGIIRCEGNKNYHIDSGCIRITALNPGERLQQVFKGIAEVVQTYSPQQAAVEQVFMHQNPGAALKLGQARGAAIVALNIPISEYSARQVKQSVVGYGAAKKEQVQEMVKRLLNLDLSQSLQADAADALAIALCHSHMQFSLAKIGVTPQRKNKPSSWRNFVPT